MENRIKEQMCLFADRLSTDESKGNQLRLYFSALACFREAAQSYPPKTLSKTR